MVNFTFFYQYRGWVETFFGAPLDPFSEESDEEITVRGLDIWLLNQNPKTCSEESDYQGMHKSWLGSSLKFARRAVDFTHLEDFLFEKLLLHPLLLLLLLLLPRDLWKQ